jgi:hypothetical protein
VHLALYIHQDCDDLERCEASHEADLDTHHEEEAEPATRGGDEPVEDLEALLIRLGMKDIGGWRFETTVGSTRVGKINYIVGNMKATCQLHKECSCYVSLKSVPDRLAVPHLVQWLHSARAHNWDRRQHLDSAIQLKTAVFKMKVRGV